MVGEGGWWERGWWEREGEGRAWGRRREKRREREWKGEWKMMRKQDGEERETRKGSS